MLQRFSFMARAFSFIILLIGLFTMKSIRDELGPIWAAEEQRKEQLYSMHVEELNNKPFNVYNYDNIRFSIAQTNNDFSIHVNTSKCNIKTTDNRIITKQSGIATLSCSIIPFNELSNNDIEALKNQDFTKLESGFETILWGKNDNNFIISYDNNANIYMNDNKTFHMHLKDSRKYLLRLSIVYNSSLKNDNKLQQTYTYIILN